MPKVRVKPGRGVSLFGMIVGMVFVCIGLFIAIPMVGLFGVFWTLLAGGITIFHAINAFSARGIATEEYDVYGMDVDQIEVDGGHRTDQHDDPDSFDTRLRRLERLREEGLISDAEYFEKREEIMGERW